MQLEEAQKLVDKHTNVKVSGGVKEYNVAEEVEDNREFLKGNLCKRWIRALTSGDYARTERVLWGTDGFCCLGVLCRQYNLRAIKTPSNRTGEPAVFLYKEDKMVRYLSEAFRIKLGMSDRLQTMLANMNDGGEPFAVTAAFLAALRQEAMKDTEQ